MAYLRIKKLCCLNRKVHFSGVVRVLSFLFTISMLYCDNFAFAGKRQCGSQKMRFLICDVLLAIAHTTLVRLYFYVACSAATQFSIFSASPGLF